MARLRNHTLWVKDQRDVALFDLMFALHDYCQMVWGKGSLHLLSVGVSLYDIN